MNEPPDLPTRDVCWTCRRPTVVCWCADLRPVPSATRVVFLQHPRETKVPVSTCRMAHRSLPNSELHVGLGAEGNPRLEALCRQGDVAVLFPSAHAADVETLEAPPATLIVVDGTWSNAKKVVEKSPLLAGLPRLKFRPERPGNYRIRREPDDQSLSTIEATAYVLERLERAPGRFVPMLNAFDAMVERQLAYINGSSRQTRHAFSRRRNSVPVDHAAPLRAAGDRLVVVFGEANAWPPDHPGRPADDRAELVQLVAERLGSGERFSSMLVPHRPLGPTVAFHLDVDEAALTRAPARAEVLARFEHFLGPDALLVGWGSFCQDLLAQEGLGQHAFLNLRSLVAQLERQRPGSVEARALALGAQLPDGQGRAARRLVALSTVTRALLAEPGRPSAHTGLHPAQEGQ